MICSACRKDISSCDQCGDEFEEEDDIICCENEHFHDDCFNEWLRGIHHWESGEVLDADDE